MIIKKRQNLVQLLRYNSSLLSWILLDVTNHTMTQLLLLVFVNCHHSSQAVPSRPIVPILRPIWNAVIHLYLDFYTIISVYSVYSSLTQFLLLTIAKIHHSSFCDSRRWVVVLVLCNERKGTFQQNTMIVLLEYFFSKYFHFYLGSFFWFYFCFLLSTQPLTRMLRHPW